MGGKRRGGNAQGKKAADQDGAAAQGGASRKRQTRGLSVHDGAALAEAGSCGPASAEPVPPCTLSPVTLSLNMRWDTSAQTSRKAALEAALRKVVTEFGGRDFRLEWTRVGQSEDTLQRVLSLVLERVGPEGAMQCFQTCKAWRGESQARGFCHKTFRLCSLLAKRGELERIAQNALQHLNTSTVEAERVFLKNINAFLQKWWGRLGAYQNGSLHQSLQAASQEPDSSFLSRGSASTAQILGLPLVKWLGKPQGRFPGLRTLGNLFGPVYSVSFSPDGTHIITGSGDSLLKLWDAATGAEVCNPGGLTF